jgi:streptogramin lyase
MRYPRLVSIALLSALAACGGGNVLPGGLGAGPLPAVRSDSRVRVPVTVRVVIGHRHHRHRGFRKPKFVSPGTNGFALAIYPHGAAHTTENVVASALVDVSPGSKACGGSTGYPRTCGVHVALEPTNGGPGYDIVIGTFDSPPSPSGSFAGANLLGVGTLSNAGVALGKANDFVVYVSGVIASLSGNPANVSLPSDGAPHTLGIVIDPEDFGNHAIHAGTNDPFANPISVTLKEIGGSGNMLLSLNGGAGTTQVTVSHSNDTVQLLYNGGGQINYGATVTLTAPAVAGFGGATESVNVNPLILFAGGNYYYQVPPYLTLGGNGDEMTMYAMELNSPPLASFSATPAHCAAIADTTVVKPGIFGIPSFNVFARPVISQDGSCTISVSDGSSTDVVQVLNSYNGVTGTPVVTELGMPSNGQYPTGIAVGADGNMWFGESTLVDGDIGSVTPTGNSPTFNEYPFPTGNGQVYASKVAPGPDGKMWTSNTGYSSDIGTMSISGTGATFPTTTQTYPKGIVEGPDGAMWFTQSGTSNAIGRITTDGTVKSSGAINTGTIGLSDITVGPDGSMWFTETNAGIIGKITTDMVVTQIPLAAGSQPDGITAGPDGALWFADRGKRAIGRIPTTATTVNPQVLLYYGMTGSAPTNITTGPDSALWFTECNDSTSGPHAGYSVVGRLDAYSHAMTEYTVGLSSAKPWGIASGPDGAVWFTEFTTSSIDRIALATSAAIRRRPSVVPRPPK